MNPTEEQLAMAVTDQQSSVGSRPAATVQARPAPTVAQVKTFAQAIFSGKYAAPEIVAQRMVICRKCDKLRVTPAGVVWCGACGCRVSRKDREITNLAAYEENLPKWGCKHPLRKKGKGWPMTARDQKPEGRDQLPLASGQLPTVGRSTGGIIVS